MEPSSTSKVAVTYWDPAALYQLIAADLRPRLPLRNLHWKSPTRPLRSISSLHVDLTPYSATPSANANLSSGSSTDDLTRVKSNDSSRSAEIATGRASSRAPGPRKERRHQIPGLRNTPYLKVYLLRCDDNDSYKNTQRKLLREWISAHATSAGGDNHDAFEWLIIHVVLPGTPAAQQPRSSSSASNAGGRPGWMKSGSPTLLDKIRSDFNGSGSKVDRVAQIRIPPSHPALQTLSPPVAPIAATLTPESPQEAEVAWLDLVAKLKSQILSSFDARVTQYEEDIREKDAQRRLPGWNFCTFFVLKEGLARAFESVGLVEDALVLYDELEFGLEAIVREQEKGEVVGGRFIAWTKEALYWLEEARKSLQARKCSEGDGVVELDEGNPIASEKKPYRELILSNEISVFDFRCYVFARQATLLMRLGRRSVADPNLNRSTPGNTEHEGDDLYRLAAVCQRGVEFVTAVSRVLRADLTAPQQDSEATEGGDNVLSQEELVAIVENLIASWAYAVCMQLLDQTGSASLPEGLEDNSQSGLLPRRSSSLLQGAASYAQPLHGNVSGLEELAAARADLIVLARTVLERVSTQKGLAGRKEWFYVNRTGELEDVNLDGDDRESKEQQPSWMPEGLRNKELREAVFEDTGEIFHKRFLQLTEKAMKYYGVAKRYKNAERAESELAALKFHLKDYQTAAVHLRRMTSFYAEQGWGLVETTLLSMYAKCLKEMHKPEEYVAVLLKLLSRAAAAEKALVRKRAGKHDNDLEPPLGRTGIAAADVQGYVAEIAELCHNLPKDITVPMSNLWSDITVDPYPRHFPDRDGFEVGIKVRYLLSGSLRVDKMVVETISTSPSGRELCLESTSPFEMKRGIVKATAITTNTMPGSYIAERVIFHAGKLVFVHEFMAKTTPTTPLGAPSRSAQVAAVMKTKLSFFPALRALTGRLEMPKNIQLEQTRTVEVVINVGENHISKGEFRIRSATAGLRLMTRSLEVLSGADAVETSQDSPGTLRMKDTRAGTDIRVLLPYSSESELTELMIRLEVDYTTQHGDFGFIEPLTVPVALPLSVNVQDIFRSDSLYSKFQVSTAAAEVPLRVFTANLHDSATFYAEAGKGTSGCMTVYAKQPANFTYKIKKRKDVPDPPESLSLVVKYTNLDEEIRHTISSIFESELKEGGLERYVNWVLPFFFSRFRHRSPNELEMAALLEEVELGTYEEYGWEDALEAIDPQSNARQMVEDWLKGFFSKHPRVALNQKQILQDIMRSIVIPVDVPALQVVHTIELNLLCDSDSGSLEAPYAPPMVTVGEGLPAELVIRHSREWDTADSASSEPMEFSYEVQNNPDTWLVSGRKKAHFKVVDGGVEKCPLLLVPVKPGHLVLPNVEIKQVGNVFVSMETDYKGNAATILVLPDIRSTTVRIDSMYGGEQIAGKA